MATEGDAVRQFMETTGAEEKVAKFFVESSKGDVMRALDSFFESGGEMPEDGTLDAHMHDDSDDHGFDEEELSRAEAGAGPSGPATLDDVTSALFKKAEQTNPEDLMKEAKDPKRTIFKGKGFALGKDAEAESEVVEAGAARPAPKAFKVTVWKGNAFQVDDGEVRYCDRGPDQEKNQQFMKDLSMNIPPAEMRELDPSGRPIPVNISLADHREEDPSNAQPPQKTLSLVKDEQVVKPKFKAFGGGGNVLGKDWTAEAYSKVSAAADASPASGGRGPPAPVVQSKEELASQLKEYAADASAPDVTSIQPLSDENASLKDAALLNAAVIVRLL